MKTTKTPDIKTVARDVAAALGEGWSSVTPEAHGGLTPAYSHMKLCGPQGIVLSLQFGDWRAEDRWHVSGDLTSEEFEHAPSSYDKQAPQRPTKITMAASKTAAQIAKDIKRRYLDQWTAYATEARTRLGHSDARRRRVIATGDVLIAALDGQATWAPRPHSKVVPGELDPARSELTIGRHNDPVQGEMKILGHIDEKSTRVKVELEMSGDDAVAVAEFLAQRRHGGRGGEQNALPLD